MNLAIRRAYVDIQDGVQLHYREAGVANGPLIVMLHQTPSSSAMYEPLMLSMADDFHIIAFDTPGFGLSDGLPGTFNIANAASAISAAVAQLHDGACFWFGHHTGAALALQIAHDQPQQVARLAMSGPCLLNDVMREKLPIVAAEVPIAQDGSHLQILWQRIAAKDSDATLELRQREVLAGAAAGPAYAQAYQSVVELDTAVQLRALQCPTLVFAGTSDPLYGQLDAAFKLLKDGQKAEIPAAKTFVCERQTDAVAALLRPFFGAKHV